MSLRATFIIDCEKTYVMNDVFSPHRFTFVNHDLIVGDDSSSTFSNIEPVEECSIFSGNRVVLYEEANFVKFNSCRQIE